MKVTVNSCCDKVIKLDESLGEIDQWEATKPLFDCVVYKAAAECKLHITCPVPIAILKAIEVETGLAVQRDASLHFELDDAETVEVAQADRRNERNA